MQHTRVNSCGFLWCFIAIWQWREIASCRVGCVCDDALPAVTCIGLNLTSVPDDIAFQTRFLNLSANRIGQINDDDFQNVSELEILDLSHNSMSNISSEAWKHTVRLQKLILDHNSLNYESISSVSVMIQLEELCLAANRISNVYNFVKLSSLSALDLSENAVIQIPATFFEDLPNLQRFSLSGNQLSNFFVNISSPGVLLRELNLSSNFIDQIDISGNLMRLEVLDLSWNQLYAVNPDWFRGLPNLTTFVFSGNPVANIPEFSFIHLPNLLTLELSFLQNVTSIMRNAFYGLDSLECVRMSHNSALTVINGGVFNNLANLRYVDISKNNLSTFESDFLSSLASLEVLDLSGNPLSCDCSLIGQIQVLEVIFSSKGHALSLGPTCEVLPQTSVSEFLNQTVDLSCQVPRIINSTKEANGRIGSSVLFNCSAVALSKPQIVWIANRNQRIVQSEENADLLEKGNFSLPDSYSNNLEQMNRMFVLPNGSLYIAYVTRKEGGTYRCIATNEFGNDTAVVTFLLNYDQMSLIAIKSIIFGFLTAAGFFLIAVIIGIARYLAFLCSKKEKKKRKSIREVLDSIQDYKSAQFDRFSAYRTAKMDQLYAFKLAKIDQFSAFRTARVDKLRTYKQATVTSVLHYMEGVREHYANQTARIKENCVQQMDKLRENYGVQRGKFKDYRSHQVEKMRENYNSQVLKIREYGVTQMARLREQYKAQQQNVLKLLELLDIGNCVTVIEAECMHTESVIFDASIEFDVEAHPIHVPRETDSTMSDESHYLTASEDGSGSNIPMSVSCTAEIEPTSRLAELSVSLEQLDDYVGDFGGIENLDSIVSMSGMLVGGSTRETQL